MVENSQNGDSRSLKGAAVWLIGIRGVTMYRDTWPRDTRIVSPPKYRDILDDTTCGESRYISTFIAIQMPIYRDS